MQKNDNGMLLTENDIDDYMLSGTQDGIKKRVKAVRNGNRIVATSRDELKQVLFGNADGYANTISFGRVSADLTERVLESSRGDIDLTNGFLELELPHGKHSIKHLNPTKPGNLPMTEDEVVNALLRTNEADVIRARIRKNGERNVQLSLDTGDGKIVLIELSSKNTGGLKLKTIWKVDYDQFDKWYKSNPDVLSNLKDSVIPNGNKYSDVAFNSTISQ